MVYLIVGYLIIAWLVSFIISVFEEDIDYMDVGVVGLFWLPIAILAMIFVLLAGPGYLGKKFGKWMDTWE